MATSTKITKRTVDATKPAEDRYFVWDSEIRGFGLLVLPTGVKSFIYRYRTPQGRLCQPTIGKYGDFTPDQARAKADEFRAVVKGGGDPLAEKQARHNALTVAALLDRYLASEQFKGKTAMTQANDRGRIERHLKPTLGRRIADSLTGEDVKRAMTAIGTGKTAVDVKTRSRGRARVKGGEGAARMAIALLRASYSWAIREGLAKANPCAHVEIGVSGSRDTILEDASGYGRLFATLDRMEAEYRLRRPAADAIRVIAMTGARKSEVTCLKWSHVDLKRGLITIPPSGHKTGKRTGKPRTIGLPAAAQAIVARQPAGEDNDLVFQPVKGEGPLTLSKVWRTIRVEAKLPAGIGLHGLRHSLATHMAMSGAGAAEIMAQLGHRQMSTADRYIHYAQDMRQGLAERSAKTVMAGMSIADHGTTAEITPLKRR